jgi:hypothetical protein
LVNVSSRTGAVIHHLASGWSGWPRSGHSHRITGQAQRVEIAKEPRRRWSDDEKRRLGTDVLRRINGHRVSRFDELLPWNWKGRSARLVA